MRVGIISDTLYERGKGTGQSRYLSNILTYLDKVDRENEYVLFHRSSSPNEFYERYEHVEYGRYSSKVPLPFFVSWEVAFAKALRKNHVDMVHEPACVGLPLLSFQPRSVVTLMDVMANLWPRRFALKGTTEFRTRLPAVLWKTDSVIAPSENSAKDIQNVFSSTRGKVSVVPLGLTPDFSRRGEKEVEEVLGRVGVKRPYVLMHAVHRWNKNTLGAVKAFKRAVETEGCSEFSLILSGGMTPELQGQVRSLVSSLDIADRTILTGYLDDEAVPALLSGATAFIYPAYYEGFGFPILEAMYCAAPIVASSIPTTLEILGDGGLVAGPDDIEVHADNLVKVMTDKVLAARLSSNALAQSRKFTAEGMTRGTVEVFREVLAREPRWRV